MPTRLTRHPVSRVARRKGGTTSAVRIVPEETPVAFSYGGTTHAVMMATPSDMEDFAVGFSLSEGIIENASDIREIAVEDHDQGIDIQITLAGDRREALNRRRRHMAGPVGCGLCGIESIDEALKPVALVGSNLHLTAGDIAQSVKLLSARQPLHTETGAVHAAGFYVPGKGIVAAREDVGRHNALDKLAGALARQGIDGANGAVVVTSRVSIEMVQKTAITGAPVLIAVSAPTALAIRTAEAAGITLVALVRGDEFDIYTHTDRIETAFCSQVEPDVA
ncbi:formate dehydrogenase accessory sulfurtransferase FdhD [Phyllobacterium salinisoli]|uniref:formate dehydrogenase accessory sulfurtransferase FdhD n=1 Tax=Phyllobacterium salinisoli TaxID=1899321 RepID=UPI001FE24274|nr:formate dehydrogenase accessory sulfurtransferase FdhD [Phyllobacterium salinisoli]